MIFWLLLLGVVTLTLYFRRIYTRFSRHGVKQVPIIPLLGDMGKVVLRKEHFVDYLNNTYLDFPGERFVGKYQFISPIVMIRDLDLVKKVTIKDFEHFIDHRTFVNEKTDPIFGRNLLSLKDQEWKDMRSTLSPAFTSSKIRLMVPFMVEVGEQMVKTLKKKIEDSGVDYFEVEAKDMAARYANDVIATCAFGLKVDSHTDEDNQFYKMGQKSSAFTLRQMMIFLMHVCFPSKFMEKLKISVYSESTKNFFRDLVLNTMQDRETRNVIRPDMIHLLMEAKKGRLTHEDKTSNDTDAGFATVEESSVGKRDINRVWSDDDLCAQAVLFLSAGFETVATTMAFLLNELAFHPEVQDKLVKEINETHQKNNGKFDYNTIQHMKYMDMVVSEVLRLWPPAVGLERICTKDYNLGRPNSKATEDFILRKGEGLGISTWSFHRDPELFPDPTKFDPERFSDENQHKIKPISYLPFGIGPRNCIGSRFALCELKVMVYQLLQYMEVVPSPQAQRPIKLCTNSFTLKIVGGHWVRLRVRT